MTVASLSRSYPIARMSEGIPTRFELGARKTITALAIADDGDRQRGVPACFALTSTPSIGPSSEEVTCPVNDVNAVSLCACAGRELRCGLNEHDREHRDRRE